MGILLTIIYMLIGSQVSGRVFYWATEGKDDIASYAFCLGLVTLAWPVFIVLSFFPKTAYFNKAIWRWYE